MGTDGIDGHKRETRRRLIQLRRGLGKPERARIDAAIEERLCSLEDFDAAEVLLTYLDFGSEVRTRGIIERAWAAKKTVALPRCAPGSREMRWYRVTGFDGLVRSGLGVEEPPANAENEQPIGAGERTLAIVPGLTFDKRGYRLGYGGGFYDTFLAGFDGVSVGLCREAQLSEDLREACVVDQHDLPVHLVMTEKRVLDNRVR